MSLWLPHPLFLPFIIVGVTILLWATSPLPEFMTALLFFAVAMGPGKVPAWAGMLLCIALAVIRQSDGSFVLLATERNLLIFNRASAEEIQDHQCDILNQQVIK